MAHGVIYGQDGVVRVPLARTRLPVNGIVAGSGIVAGATPNTFVVQELGYHQIDFDFNVNSPTNDTPFTLQLWNETAGMLVQSRNAVSPQQAHASDMYFGFEWNNASLTDEYAFYVVPNIGTAPNGFALLLQEINFRAVVQEFAGASGTVGPGTINRIAKFTAVNAVGDSIMAEAGTVISVAGSVNLAGVNTDTFLSFTDGQNVPVSAASTGRIRYNALTQTFQFSENGGAWADLSGIGPGTINRIAKFTAADAVGDSTITDDGTTVTVNTSMSVTATQTRLGVASTLTGSLIYANATNANTVTLQSGVTAASYTLTLPLAQSGAGQVLSNDGAGVLSWATPVLGSGSANALAKFTAATTVGDSSIADVGTGVTQVQTVAITGSPTAWTLTAAAHTTLTASVEAPDVNYNLARTVQFDTGAIATQRAFRIQAPTYAFVAGSTITTAATVSISGAPASGANATITNPYAFWVEAGRTQFDGDVRVGMPSAIDGSVKLANASGADIVNLAQYANVQRSINISGIDYALNDSGEGDYWLNFSSRTNTIYGPEVDFLGAPADFTVTCPANCKVWVEEVGWILTVLTLDGGALTVQPTVRAGITGTLAKLLAAVPTTLLTAAGTRERYITLLTDVGETTLTAGFTVAGTIAGGGAGIAYKGRPFWVVRAVENE